MTKNDQPKTKFKVGDWVYYNGTLFKIDQIAKSDAGYLYALKYDMGVNFVKVEEGDKYFKKA